MEFNYISIKNEYDMLKGNINRMFVSDDIDEVISMYEFAKKRLERIFSANHERVLELQK